MIARMTGTLIELNSQANSVLLELGDMAYEIFVPAYTASDLSARMNHTITLYCLEYLEGTGGGNSFTPILIGFPQQRDKVFFQKFISVKGIGIRKALRALAQPLADIAYSIEQGDTKRLQSLPEIGRRTAEQVVAELKGKLADFVGTASSQASKAGKAMTGIEQQALEILLQLGERMTEAEEWIRRVMENNPEIKTTDLLVQAVYRMKAKAI